MAASKPRSPSSLAYLQAHNPVPPVLSGEPTLDEIEFRADQWHHLWLLAETKAGRHHPDFHVKNLQVVPPPIRADGKTYCDSCNLSMVAYYLLSQAQRDVSRELVKRAFIVDKAFEDLSK